MTIKRDEFFDEDMFDFLDDLRDSGEINMWAAAPYIQEAYNLDSDDARDVLVKWMHTYGDRHPKLSDLL